MPSVRLVSCQARGALIFPSMQQPGLPRAYSREMRDAPGCVSPLVLGGSLSATA